MRVLLTGGTGFFGRALLRHWLGEHKAGRAIPQVSILSRSPEQFQAQYSVLTTLPGLRLLRGDVGDPASLPYDGQFTHVLHAAAESTLGPQLTPLQRYDQIVGGTRHLLDFAVACGARRFLLTSSGAVYGELPADLTQCPEDWRGAPDALNPSLAYGVAKRAAEHLCASYSQEFGLETVIARCFAFVGQDLPLNVHFAIGNFIRDALYSDAIIVNGDGRALRSYMDQRDLAQWLLVMLAHGRAGQAYNVGSDHAVSIRDLAYTVRDLLAPRKEVRVLGVTESATARHRYIPNILKAREELGLDITVNLEAAIRFTACALVT